jgi:hypothetical protein
MSKVGILFWNYLIYAYKLSMRYLKNTYLRTKYVWCMYLRKFENEIICKLVRRKIG